jgi:hypothetical protein
MITLENYFGQIEHTAVHEAEAEVLLDAVNPLMQEAFMDGVDFKVSPVTMNHVATHDGGFRLPDCAAGRKLSAHKEAKAVDVFDGNKSDGQPFAKWCAAHPDRLAHYGLYMEHPSATIGKWTCWCHLTTRAPGSGRRVFYP